MLLDTDASGLGWGVVLDQNQEARIFHGLDINGLRINCLELGAISRALASFRYLLPRGTVPRVRTGSAVARFVIRAGSSRSLVMMSEMRALHELCAEMKVELRVEHVSSVFKAWADRLSREHDSTDWTWGALAFARL